jgi:HD-GYP domain-containing protein (c-di-GMP phosphodiesterase class II)
MKFDSYESPDAESLLRSGRRRYAEPEQARRSLITEAAAAAAFVIAALLLAALGASPRPMSVGTLAACAVAFLIAARVTFQVGSAWTRPTQLVFVPMLFVLPVQFVPLIVAGLLLIDLWPQALSGKVSLTRVFARVGDSFYALGPALVLVLAGEQTFSWSHWPVLILAFGAQVVFDAGAGLARTWFAEGIRPSEQWPMLWLYGTDLCLSTVGLLIAGSAARRPGLVLLALPLIGLLALFARERQQRLDHTLALSTAYRGTALLLGDVVEADDRYTGIHSREVVDLSLGVAGLMGLKSAAKRNVEFAALLHDVGKIRVPKEIINKPGRLDEVEMQIMRRHTIDGEQMLKQVGGTLAGVGRFVRASHERFDGQGYPDGLAGGEIPIEARIIAVCDAFNAMTTDRPYRSAVPEADAVDELRRGAGTQFDPDVVHAFELLLSVDETSTPQRPQILERSAVPEAHRRRSQLSVR